MEGGWGARAGGRGRQRKWMGTRRACVGGADGEGWEVGDQVWGGGGKQRGRMGAEGAVWRGGGRGQKKMEEERRLQRDRDQRGIGRTEKNAEGKKRQEGLRRQGEKGEKKDKGETVTK